MSNGSTSMASVCGSSLSLMDAGVPIAAPVAGIAMGLITGQDEREYRVLTDIAGVEDGLGDMDFKVAGTALGVTAVQLDIKLQSLPEGLLETVFERARDARMRILEVMHEAIAEPRRELSQFAPRVEAIQVEKEKIGAVIGPGGRVINAMQDETGASINVEDDGTVLVSGTDAAGVRRAIEMIRGLTKEIEVGEVYEGSVTRIMAFGAFVEILPGKDGLVHISDLADYHVNRVEDEVNEGDVLRVRVIEIRQPRPREPDPPPRRRRRLRARRPLRRGRRGRGPRPHRRRRPATAAAAGARVATAAGAAVAAAVGVVATAVATVDRVAAAVGAAATAGRPHRAAAARPRRAVAAAVRPRPVAEAAAAAGSQLDERVARRTDGRRPTFRGLALGEPAGVTLAPRSGGARSSAAQRRLARDAHRGGAP